MISIVLLLFLRISLSASQDGIFFRDESLEVGSPCQKSLGSGICVLPEKCRIPSEMIARGQLPICFFHEHRTPVLCCPTQNLTTTGTLIVDKPVTSFLDNLPPPSSLITEQTTLSTPPTVTTTTTKKTSALTASERPQRLSEMKCKEYTHNYTTPAMNYYAIVLGDNAGPGEFPHMAAIGAEDPAGNGTLWYCGGSLISDRFILTAAHCLTRNSPKVIRLGSLDITTNDGQDYEPESIIVHPQYRSTSVYNDIALIRLNDTVKFTRFIRPACLNTLQNTSNKLVMATGWGHTSFGGVESSLLQKVTLDFFSEDQCSMHYKPARRISEGLQLNTQICAGSNSTMKDTCQGDSGGPLSFFVYTEEIRANMHHIVGLTSFGKGCGAQIPAIYTRVYFYLDWIESIAWN